MRGFPSTRSTTLFFNHSHRNLPSNPSPSSHFSHLLRSCCSSRSLKQGKQIHQQIIIHGFTNNSYLVTKLLQFYAECGDSVTALHLFDEIPRRNVFAWTAILTLHLRHAEYENCLESYRQMLDEHIEPDNYVFPKVLKACALLSDFKKGAMIHKDIETSRYEPNLHVYNSLIDMYCKCGDSEKGRQVFDEMPERNLLSWNSMISGYVYNGCADLALELFGSKLEPGLCPDVVTWNTIIAAYCQRGDLEKAFEILNRLKENSVIEPNIISWTTLITGYSRSGQHGMALRVFREMMSAPGIDPDSDTLSCVLSSCRHMEALRNGREIHGCGIKNCIEFGFYDSAGAALLSMYCACCRIRDARNVFEKMDKRDVVSWNAMIMGLVHLGMGDSALDCFREMRIRGVKPGQITVASLLPACSSNIGKQIHAYIQKNWDFDMDTLSWNALMSLYAKCGSIEAVYAVFSGRETRDLVTWNTMIGAYGNHGDGISAVQILHQMEKMGIRPNSVTFTCVLSACSHSGLVSEGKQIFDNMIRDYGLAPTMEHFACIVDMLGRAGQLKEAVDFIAKMPVEATASVWGALLSASLAHQSICFGRFAAEKLLRIEPENPGNYVTLSNIYTRAGRWEDALKVRKLMEERGFMKPSGYSWIEEEGLVATRIG